jgi:hypothetical protein
MKITTTGRPLIEEDGGQAEPHALVSLDKSSAHQLKEEFKKFIPFFTALPCF